MRCNKCSACTHHASSLTDVVCIFFAEQFDTAGNRTRGSVSKRTERFAADVITDIHQKINVAIFAITMLYALQNLC